MCQQRHLHNFLNRNFEIMLYPLNKAMSLLLLPNYIIQDGFVTSNNRYQKLKCLMVIVCLIIATYYRFLSYIVINDLKSIVLFIYFDLFYYITMYLSLLVSNICYTKNYVDLVINLQKALRAFHYVDNDLKRLTFWNWASIIIVPVYYSLNFVKDPKKILSIAVLLHFLPIVYFDIVVVYTIRMMWIIAIEMRIWVNSMLHWTRRHRGSETNEQDIGLEKKMFASYRCILKAFEQFKKVCQISVAYQAAEVITHALVYLQFSVDLKKQTPELNWSEYLLHFDRMMIMSWVIKNGVLLSLLCYACESFYSHMEEAQSVCSQALKLKTSEEFRRLFKNVCRLKTSRNLRARVCGATVDAQLPLTVMRILATYVVVLLQFDLL